MLFPVSLETAVSFFALPTAAVSFFVPPEIAFTGQSCSQSVQPVHMEVSIFAFLPSLSRMIAGHPSSLMHFPHPMHLSGSTWERPFGFVIAMQGDLKIIAFTPG